jgi:hypothetical protein
MVIHKEGDTSKAICEKCGKIVPMTFRYDYFVANGSKVPEVLQGFCDICGDSVSLPHQSTFRIREYRDSHSSHPLELRIPPHYTDILLAIGSVHKVSRKPNLLCRLVSELYLSKVHQPDGQSIRRKIIEALDDDLAQGKSRNRLSCVFPDITYATLKTVSGEEHKTTSDIVKGIIVVAKHDLLDNENKVFGKEFEELAVTRQ